MTMEELEEGKSYSIEWLDGDYKTNCKYVRENRGFWIFVDEHNNKIICRPTSIRKVVLIKG